MGRHFGLGCGRWRCGQRGLPHFRAFICVICCESLLGRTFRPHFCLDPFSCAVVKQAESICYLHGAWACRRLWSIWPASHGDGPAEGLPAGFAGLCSQGTAESQPPAPLASTGGLVFHARFGFSRSNLRPLYMRGITGPSIYYPGHKRARVIMRMLALLCCTGEPLHLLWEVFRGTR